MRDATKRTSRLIRREFEPVVLEFQKRTSNKRLDSNSLAIEMALDEIQPRSSKIVMAEFRQCMANYLEREARLC
jgi:hypothetical protein